MSSASIGRSGLRPRTAWRDRVRVLGSAAGVDTARLAELVEAELSRCEGLLFTATPTEELDEISRWGRLADSAWCGQVRAVLAAHLRMSPAEREFLGCEVALALNLSDGSAQDLVATALLTASAPGLLEAVETGMLTVRHVHAVLGALAGTGLCAEEQCAVVTIALARYTDQTPAQLGRLVARLVLTVNAAAAACREADRTFHRGVRFRAVEDGQGLITARGPLAMIEAVRAALDAKLPRSTAAGSDPQANPDQANADQGERGAVPQELRTREAREFDLLVDLLTGGWDQVPQSAGSGGWTPAIVIPYSTAAGQDLELADIPGLGPVLPGTARELLQGCVRVRRVAVDAQGRVLEVSDLLPGPAASATDRDPDWWLTDLAEMPLRIGIPAGSAGYQPSDRLRRFLEARDRTCTFPGCTRPATQADKDHAIPWPLGPTTPDNLHSLCRRHHRAKQTIFTVLRLPDGTTRWITRGGWWFDRQPQGY